MTGSFFTAQFFDQVVLGARTRADGSVEELSLATLLAPLDGALAALSLGMVATACALVAARL